ncbi:hydroxyacylglutathione hydrolase [Bacillus sp. RC252]
MQLVEPLVSKYNCKVYISRKEADYYGFQRENMETLEDQRIILLGDTSIRCILTPGHTVGGMCYSLSHSLFTGDTLFIEGCGICNSDGGDPYKMFESIKKIKSIIDPNVLVYPGHSFGKSPGLSMEVLMDHNLYFHIDDVETFVKFRMRPNQQLNYNFV